MNRDERTKTFLPVPLRGESESRDDHPARDWRGARVPAQNARNRVTCSTRGSANGSGAVAAVPPPPSSAELSWPPDIFTLLAWKLV